MCTGLPDKMFFLTRLWSNLQKLLPCTASAKLDTQESSVELRCILGPAGGEEVGGAKFSFYSGNNSHLGVWFSQLSPGTPVRWEPGVRSPPLWPHLLASPFSRHSSYFNLIDP